MTNADWRRREGPVDARKAITAGALLLAVIHLAWPAVDVDFVFLTLLLVACVPWLGPIRSALALPGGWRLDVRALEDAARRAERAGLLASGARPEGRAPFPFELVVDEDANLALAGLRIEIEARLTELARSRGIESPRTVSGLLRALEAARALSPEERDALSDVIRHLNAAVHGAPADVRHAEWARDVGPRLLAGLALRVEGEGSVA